MDDWWFVRAVEHGLAIVMPDGAEVVLPNRIAQRFAVAVWEQMSLDERNDAVQFVERSRAYRQGASERREANHQALFAVGLVRDESPMPMPKDDVVDLSQPFGDPAQGEPMPEAWAPPVYAGGTLLFADDNEDARMASKASFRARDEEAQRLHEECLVRWASLTEGQLRNYRQHDWQAHLGPS
jgi:hypothetical protein